MNKNEKPNGFNEVRAAMCLVIACMSIWPMMTRAQENLAYVPASDIAIQEIIQLLDEESELATKTRMNIDFVPGVMTVLHGSDLTARGVQTVFDALGLVPGIELSRTNDGRPKILVRGIGLSFFSGKVKFLLNSTPFNGTLGATTNVLILPIEQVERIEVIRGPGSAIYGEYASVGVINVVTREERLHAYARFSDLDRRVIGGAVRESFNDNALQIDFSFADVAVAGGDIEVDNDYLRGFPITNAPGPINNKEDHASYILHVDYKDYAFSWQSVSEGLGDFYGSTNVLPPDEQRIVSTFKTQSFELSRDWNLPNRWQASTTLGLLDFKFQSGLRLLYPPGFQGSFPQGVLSSPNYEDDKWYVAGEFKLQDAGKHNVLLGFDVSVVEQGDTYLLRNFTSSAPGVIVPNGTPPTLVRYTGNQNWLSENHDRTVIGLYAQDQYSHSDKLKFTAGLRFDDYDDIGSDLTPRLAAVYQLTGERTFKLQYAESFRPPTFLELYTQNNPVFNGNTDLQSEQLNTLELGYVYNDGLTVFRSTLFHYTINNLIQVSSATGRYENLGEISANGLELEYAHQISRNMKVDANYSYINSEDTDSKERVAGIANVLGNIALLYEPWPDTVFSWQSRHVSYRQREIADERGDLDDYTVTDLAVNVFNVYINNTAFRGGVRNVFNEPVLYPAPLVTPPPTQTQPYPAYLNDYPQSGREFYLQFEYKLP